MTDVINNQITSGNEAIVANFDELIAQAERKEEHDRIIQEAKQAALEAQATDNLDSSAGQATVMMAADYIDITPSFVDGDFHELRNSVDEQVAKQTSVAIQEQFDQRMNFHLDNDPANTNIQKNLTIYRRQMSAPYTASALVACDADVGFVNRTKRGEQCFNVYSIDKVGRLVNQLILGAPNNKYNDAIFQSMWNFMKHGLQFTTEAARAAISDQIRVSDKQWRTLLVRHTVKPGTASTQASSSLRALEVLGVVRNVGSEKKQVWVLNDNPQTRALAATYELI